MQQELIDCGFDLGGSHFVPYTIHVKMPFELPSSFFSNQLAVTIRYRFQSYLLFAYGVRPHSCKQESRLSTYCTAELDAQLSTEAALEGPIRLSQLEGEDYRTDVLIGFSTAWASTLHKVEDVQRKYKDHYDLTTSQAASVSRR